MYVTVICCLYLETQKCSLHLRCNSNIVLGILAKVCHKKHFSKLNVRRQMDSKIVIVIELMVPKHSIILQVY